MPLPGCLGYAVVEPVRTMQEGLRRRGGAQHDAAVASVIAGLLGPRLQFVTSAERHSVSRRGSVKRHVRRRAREA